MAAVSSVWGVNGALYGSCELSVESMEHYMAAVELLWSTIWQQRAQYGVAMDHYMAAVSSVWGDNGALYGSCLLSVGRQWITVWQLRAQCGA